MKKILVIEDEPEMRRDLTTILRLEKFHPVPAENGLVLARLSLLEGYMSREGASNGHCDQKVCTTGAMFISAPRAFDES
jgi:CheY-like chemotaxis protein